MSLISKETLLMQLQRSEMASEVTLPIDSFSDLLYQAMPKEWVGLNSADWNDFNPLLSNDPHRIAKWVEKILKERNT